MDFLRRKDGGMCWVFLCVLLCLRVGLADGSLVLMGGNVTRSFDDIEANFGPAITGSNEKGVLFMAEPLNACTPLTNDLADSLISPFVLIVRGGCTFEYKVRSAQAAGFKAAVVYNNEYSNALVAMAGLSEGINIPAVFISGASGEALKNYAGRTDLNLWIIPTFENSAWSIMAISFISLLAMSAILATCFFVRRQRVRRRPRASQFRAFHGMSSQLVNAMPSLIFISPLEDNCTSRTCAICLEDYSVGEKLRVLPCRHKFHASCVDSWLTAWRTFCPVCKQDAKRGINNPPASESTPLLTPVSASPPSTVVLPSSNAYLAATPAMPIVPLLSQTPFASLTNSFSSSRSVETRRHCSINRSPIDLRNASLHKSHTFHLSCPHSLGFPLHSPLYSRYPSQCIPSSNNASPNNLVGSSSLQTFLQDCESEENFFALASTQSLPGC